MKISEFQRSVIFSWFSTSIEVISFLVYSWFLLLFLRGPTSIDLITLLWFTHGLLFSIFSYSLGTWIWARVFSWDMRLCHLSQSLKASRSLLAIVTNGLYVVPHFHIQKCVDLSGLNVFLSRRKFQHFLLLFLEIFRCPPNNEKWVSTKW